MKLHGHEVKQGDKIWSVFYGWGDVEEIGGVIISIQFEDIAVIDNLLKIEKTLFWKEQKLDYGKLLPDLKVDADVIVWGSVPRLRRKRHFKEWTEDGDMVVFSAGMSSFTTNDRYEVYKNWEIAKEEK